MICTIQRLCAGYKYKTNIFIHKVHINSKIKQIKFKNKIFH